MGDTKSGKSFWGPPFWDVIHLAAAGYDGTSSYREGFIQLLSAYTKILPCKECRAHLIENLKNKPIGEFMVDNHTLFYWTYILHDTVNQQHNTHKPSEPRKTSPNYDMVKAKYFLPLGLKCQDCTVPPRLPSQ
jgi:hypothetical protein